MAVETVDGVEHIYAPNPKLQGEHWEAEYPPIVTKSKWLVNKYTGEIFPNTEEFARRSDILEPYFGEMTRDGVNEGEEIAKINKALANVSGKDKGKGKADGEDLAKL